MCVACGGRSLKALLQRASPVPTPGFGHARAWILCSRVVLATMAEAPEHVLAGWEATLEALVSSATPALAAARLRNFAAAAAAGKPGPGGKVWSWEVLNALLDAARPRVAIPMPPRKHPQPEPLDLKGGEDSEPDEGPELFTWAWLQLPIPWRAEKAGDEYAVFPLAVACLSEAHAGSKHLVSMSALWHLLPTRGQLHNFYSLRHTELWAFLKEMGVKEGELAPPRKAWMKAEVRPEEPRRRRRTGI